jgi:hypothetical protein
MDGDMLSTVGDDKHKMHLTPDLGGLLEAFALLTSIGVRMGQGNTSRLMVSSRTEKTPSYKPDSKYLENAPHAFSFTVISGLFLQNLGNEIEPDKLVIRTLEADHEKHPHYPRLHSHIKECLFQSDKALVFFPFWIVPSKGHHAHFHFFHQIFDPEPTVFEDVRSL